MFTKKTAQRLHFRRRALVRLGLDINKTRRREIISLIHSGKAKFVSKRSNRSKVFEVEYLGKKFQIVYDSKRKNLVTVLLVGPRELLNGFENQATPK